MKEGSAIVLVLCMKHAQKISGHAHFRLSQAHFQLFWRDFLLYLSIRFWSRFVLEHAKVSHRSSFLCSPARGGFHLAYHQSKPPQICHCTIGAIGAEGVIRAILYGISEVIGYMLPLSHKVRLSNLYLYSNYSVLFVIPFAGGLRILFLALFWDWLPTLTLWRW